MEELCGNPPLFKIQGCDAKRSGPLEIVAEIGGVQRNVVIDTGAEINVIARDFVWQNAWKPLVKEQKEKILGIAEQVITSDGKLVLDISIQGATVPVEFLVVPLTNMYAILGIKFMEAHDVELKLRKKDSYMKWRPNKSGKLRQVPLIINTEGPQLSIIKTVNIIQTLNTQDAKLSHIQTMAKSKKKNEESNSNHSHQTSAPKRRPTALPQAYPSF